MANVKISQLPLATSPLDSTVEMPVVQGGVTKRAGMTTIGFLQSGTGAVLRTAQNKMRDTVSVKDFGAVGDGTTNDRAAIQAAIDAVGAAGGGIVYVPPGDYILNSGLAWTASDVNLVGAGMGATRLICTFASGDIVTIGNGIANPNNCSVSDLSITSNVVKVGGAALVMRNAYNCRFLRFRLEANMYEGVVVDGGSGQFINYIDDFIIDSGLHGIVLSRDGTLPQDVFIQNGVIANCTGSGLFMKHCSGVYCTYLDLLTCQRGVYTLPSVGQRVVAVFMDGVIGDTCVENGFDITTNGGLVADWIMSNCWGASNGQTTGQNGLRIAAGAGTVSGINISNSLFFNNGGDGILLLSCSDIHLSNVSCHVNSKTVPGNKHGLEVAAGVSQWSVTNGNFGTAGLFSTNDQGYGIFIAAGASDNYQIIGTNCIGNVTGAILDGGSGTTKYISYNTGYRTSNSGSATVPSTQTSIVVNPGLSPTFTINDVLATAQGDTPERWWVEAVSSTTFKIQLASAAAANRTFSWSVRTKGA